MGKKSGGYEWKGPRIYTQGTGNSKKRTEDNSVPKEQVRRNSDDSDNMKEENVSANIFCVRYSQRGTARCKKCRKIINKGEIQMGKLVPFKDKYIHHNYHHQCLFEMFRKAKLAKNVISRIDEVDGVDCLKTKDRNTINELITKFNSTQQKPLP